MNVEPTAMVLDEISTQLRAVADQIDKYAKHMRKINDLYYAAEAIKLIIDILPALRLDLLSVYPLRACWSIKKKNEASHKNGSIEQERKQLKLW